MSLLEQPCTPRAHGRDRDSDHKRAYFAGIEERQAEEADGEEQAEEEQKCTSHGDTGDCWCLRCSPGDNGHASSHATRRYQHQLPPSEAVYCENSDGRTKSLESEE